MIGALPALAFAALPSHPVDAERDRLDNLKGLFHTHPLAALLIGMAMLSLAGIVVSIDAFARARIPDRWLAYPSA